MAIVIPSSLVLANGNLVRGKQGMFRKQERIFYKPKPKWPISAQVGGRLIHGEAKDISPFGAFIRCRKPLNLNEIFDMVVDTPVKSLNIKAEVVWSNIYGPDDNITPRGMGVRFVKISNEDRKLIEKELGQYEIGKEASDFLDTLEIELGAD
jgi:Tfp pilus assembly protein PilZ